MGWERKSWPTAAVPRSKSLSKVVSLYSREERKGEKGKNKKTELSNLSY